ncbi:MAG TPA: gliding motility-associated C-terminal domain-containing protein [Mucilaginibacter sp.]|jgi:gliding motility-associated-like protein|nr:gliding motility-associated C-terminal domain-containing protein [Mucilaginibacter sp.]
MRGLKLLFFLFLFAGFKCLGQAPNIGFEDGTFNHWDCYIGNIDQLGNINDTLSGPTDNRHTIYGKSYANELDSVCKIHVLCPNGSNYSVKLGNAGTHHQSERLAYTLTVPKGIPYSIILNYAVVLQNPGHAPYEQPKFTAKIYNVTNNEYLDCPAFDFIAASNLPGFKQGPQQTTYKDWTSATIDLSGYAGKTVRLEFTTNDCTRGGHFGYAYLDLSDNIGSAITGNAYCIGQTSATLTAPYGFAGYSWYNADMSQLVAEGRVFKISPPPPDMTKYAVVVFPFNGLGCVDTLYTVVNKIDEGFKLKVADTLFGCPGTGANLTAASVTIGTSTGTTFSYYNDSLAVSYLSNPDKVMVSGTYYIEGLNTEGCTNILPVTVNLDMPNINVTDPKVNFPATVDLSTTYVAHPGLKYSYYGDAQATKPISNFTRITTSGTYFIKAVNKTGCDTIVKVNVVVDPPPYTITAPNTFTPNNDGVNDYFNVSIVGYIRFDYLKIYNRYGQIIFSTTSPNGNWDGKADGKPVDVGTYYWVFEATNDYYHSKIIKSGSITLLR